MSVDTGIRAGEVVSLASELGVDTIVTDHHLPDVEIPRAVAVLNPNQPACLYPNKNLCGAGVALKLAQTLDTTVEELMSVMTERRIRHIPVVVEGRLAGLVSIGDVVKDRISALEHETKALHDYISHPTY